MTALQWLRGPDRIKPGIKALIYGAGGGLGTFAVQLAKYYGAEVPAFCGKMNIHVLRSLGTGDASATLTAVSTASSDTMILSWLSMEANP